MFNLLTIQKKDIDENIMNGIQIDYATSHFAGLHVSIIKYFKLHDFT